MCTNIVLLFAHPPHPPLALSLCDHLSHFLSVAHVHVLVYWIQLSLSLSHIHTHTQTHRTHTHIHTHTRFHTIAVSGCVSASFSLSIFCSFFCPPFFHSSPRCFFVLHFRSSARACYCYFWRAVLLSFSFCSFCPCLTFWSVQMWGSLSVFFFGESLWRDYAR